MMQLEHACGVVARQRGPRTLVVATMGAMKALDQLEGAPGSPQGATTGTRLSSVPLMGGAAGLGLGLALGRPDHTVIVVDGDASLLLELGGLVTVGQAAPRNFLHLVIKNGTQFSGLANLDVPGGDYDFAASALLAGYRQAFTFKDATDWAEGFEAIRQLEGPSFVELWVQPTPRRAEAGFEQAELPDLQFERMGIEAQAMREHLAALKP